MSEGGVLPAQAEGPKWNPEAERAPLRTEHEFQQQFADWKAQQPDPQQSPQEERVVRAPTRPLAQWKGQDHRRPQKATPNQWKSKGYS